MIDNYEIKQTAAALSKAKGASASTLYDDYTTAMSALEDAVRWLAEAVAEREKEAERADAAEEKLAELTAGRSA